MYFLSMIELKCKISVLVKLKPNYLSFYFKAYFNNFLKWDLV